MMLIEIHHVVLTPPAVWDSDHPVVAVVSDPVWKEEGNLLRDLGQYEFLFLLHQCFLSNVRMRCSVKSCMSHLRFVSAPAVGSTLHDPHRLRREQPGPLLPGGGGGRCERGSSLPPALVSTSFTQVFFFFLVKIWFSLHFISSFLPIGCLCFQVDAPRRRGRLQG